MERWEVVNEDTRKARETDSMLAAVDRANWHVAEDLALVVELSHGVATALVLWTDPAGETHVLKRIAGDSASDALERAVRWCGEEWSGE